MSSGVSTCHPFKYSISTACSTQIIDQRADGMSSCIHQVIQERIDHIDLEVSEICVSNIIEMQWEKHFTQQFKVLVW